MLDSRPSSHKDYSGRIRRSVRVFQRLEDGLEFQFGVGGPRGAQCSCQHGYQHLDDLNPAVSVSDGGDFAVLAYNLDTYVLDDNGNERQLRAWNATEVYRLIDGVWRIVHSRWAFTQTASDAIAS